MFLNLKKKKLKQLSTSVLGKSFTGKINGGTNENPTDTPSRTSHARCVVEGAEQVSG